MFILKPTSAPEAISPSKFRGDTIALKRQKNMSWVYPWIPVPAKMYQTDNTLSS